MTDTPTPLALIEWLDAASDNGWGTVRRSQETRIGVVCTTVGFLVRDDDDGVAVVQSYSEEGSHAELQTIPRPLIRGMWLLEESP